jgi:hypothetical protein
MFLLFIYVSNLERGESLLYTPLTLSAIYIFAISTLQIYTHGSVNGILYWVGERHFLQSTPGISLFNLFGRETLRPYATFAHPNALAAYALVSGFILLKSKKALHKTGALLSLILIGISFSQNAWLALIISPTIFFVITKLNLKTYKVFLAVIFASIIFPIFSNLAYSYSWPREISQRLELSTIAGHLLGKHFPLGIGLGVFPAAVPSSGVAPAVWWLQPVHNIYLLILTETGALGLFIFYFFASRIKMINLPILAIILTGFLDHYWLTLQQNIILAVVVLAISVNKNLIQ